MCFETNFAEAAQRKTAKYLGFVEQARAKGYNDKRFTLEMGSRGVPHLLGFEDLARDIGLDKRQLDGLLEELAWHALAGSFSIWCARNKRP